MAFYVGQKVVCVDDSEIKSIGLLAGTVCTVTRATTFLHLEVVYIAEFRTRFAVWFFARRFRPVVEKKTDISIFTALLNPENHKHLEGV